MYEILTSHNAMFLVMREIRGKSAGELAAVLRERLDAETETFASNDSFRLHGMNGRQIHRLPQRRAAIFKQIRRKTKGGDEPQLAMALPGLCQADHTSTLPTAFAGIPYALVLAGRSLFTNDSAPMTH